MGFLIPVGLLLPAAFVALLVVWWMSRQARARRIERRLRPPLVVWGADHEDRAEQGVPWPIRTYYVGTMHEVGPFWDREAQSGHMQEWRMTWLQLSAWAEDASAGDRQVWAAYEDVEEHITTVWAWDDGRLVSKTAYPWSRSAARRAKAKEGEGA